MEPRDDARSLTRRVVVESKEVAARGVSFSFVTEQISDPTEWCSVDDDHHLVYVYLGGTVHSMQTALDWGPTGQVPPAAGDIWWKPAGIRFAALVQGDVARYCEIAIPLRTLADAVLLSRIRYRDPLLHHLVEEIYSVADRDDAIARLLTDAVAETILVLIRNKYTASPPVQRGLRPLDAVTRRMIVAYLNESLDSEIHLDALAQLTGMSVQGFILAFRRAFHTTPYRFLLDLRIDRARALLSGTSQRIAEIAVAVGFSSPGHFATAFKRRVGMSPSEYRRHL
ncbi:helix-turn-helix transcriptional regulator [Mycobacterium sp. 134]|uniref:helix-turn-helix transcriptional regulator n=1 Tax=Mycobacterium sp. 134 TaxID=3400425 RepID=UPI003AAB7238